MKLNIDWKNAQKNLEKHWALYLGGALILLFLVNLISWPKDNGVRLTKVEFKEIPVLPLESSSTKSTAVLKVSGIEVIARPRNLAAIPPGSSFQAKLTGGASNGLVRAEVTQTLFVNGEALIPEGASLVGQGTSTEERLYIQFNQVVFRDGTFGNFSAVACDKEDQMVGVKGSLVSRNLGRIAGGVGLGFIGGFSSGLQEPQAFNGQKPSLKNALLNGTATTALEESRKMLSDLKNQIPIMEVKGATEICVIASGGS